GYEKYLARKLLDYPASLKSLRALGRGGEKLLGSRLPEDSGLRLRLALFDEAGLTVSAAHEKSMEAEKAGRPLTWFPGCASRYLFPATHSACRSLLASASCTLDAPHSLRCCGLADWAAGDLEGAVGKGRRNIEILEDTEGPVLVSCASCFAHLKKYPKLFGEDSRWRLRAEQLAGRLVELTDFLGNHLQPHGIAASCGEQKLRLFYHDPCHMRYGAPSVDRARELLLKSGKVEILELEDGPRCCGQGGLFHVAHPEISARIRDQLVADVLKLQPDVVTSTCSGCLMQWQQGLVAAGSEVKVLHLAQVLETLGGS
ncbi:MAG: (Fe-S)-binding protein, partial [Thermodesulfobacteriota bacterium]